MISWGLIGLGFCLVLIGTLGILRLPDVYSRLQASGVSDNAGLGIVLLGLIARNGLDRADLILGLLFILLVLTNPIVTHSIAKSAFTLEHRKRSEEP
jgi:multicomponent Na+:H+ antiporter subunit G